VVPVADKQDGQSWMDWHVPDVPYVLRYESGYRCDKSAVHTTRKGDGLIAALRKQRGAISGPALMAIVVMGFASCATLRGGDLTPAVHEPLPAVEAGQVR